MSTRKPVTTTTTSLEVFDFLEEALYVFSNYEELNNQAVANGTKISISKKAYAEKILGCLAMINDQEDYVVEECDITDLENLAKELKGKSRKEFIAPFVAAMWCKSVAV